MPKKTLTGTIISDRMEKTVVVDVERGYHHPRYRKRILTNKKYLARDELGTKRGQRVEIEECRPRSKRIRFKVLRVIE